MLHYIMDIAICVTVPVVVAWYLRVVFSLNDHMDVHSSAHVGDPSVREFALAEVSVLASDPRFELGIVFLCAPAVYMALADDAGIVLWQFDETILRYLSETAFAIWLGSIFIAPGASPSHGGLAKLAARFVAVGSNVGVAGVILGAVSWIPVLGAPVAWLSSAFPLDPLEGEGDTFNNRFLHGILLAWLLFGVVKMGSALAFGALRGTAFYFTSLLMALLIIYASNFTLAAYHFVIGWLFFNLVQAKGASRSG